MNPAKLKACNNLARRIAQLEQGAALAATATLPGSTHSSSQGSHGLRAMHHPLSIPGNTWRGMTVNPRDLMAAKGTKKILRTHMKRRLPRPPSPHLYQPKLVPGERPERARALE